MKTKKTTKRIMLDAYHSKEWLLNEARKYDAKVVFILPNGTEIRIKED